MKNLLRDKFIRKLINNSSILISGTAVSQVLGLVTLLLTTRLLGIELFGVFVLIQTYVLIIDLIFNVQTWQPIIKYGAEELEKGNKENFKSIIKYGTGIDIFTAILATSVGLILVEFIVRMGIIPEGYNLAIYLYVFSLFFNIISTPIAILRIFGKFKLQFIHMTTIAILKVAGILLLYFTNISEIYYVVIIWAMAEIVGNLVLFIISHRLLNRQGYSQWWASSNVTLRNDVFKFTFWTNLTSILDLPIKQLDMFIVSVLVSVEGVAIYRIIKQIGKLLSKIGDAVYQSIYPQLATLISQGKQSLALRYSMKSGLLILSVIAPIAFIVSITYPVWISFFFEGAFSSYFLAVVLYIILRSISLAFVCIHPLFIAMGLVKHNVLILIIANTFYLIATYLLGIKFGLEGIVLAYGIQFISLIILKIYFIKRTIRTEVTSIV